MGLTIEINKGEAGTYGVKLGGDLDADTSPELDQRMEGVWADPDARSIRMELQDLVYISSMGLGSLAKIRKMAAGRGGAMVTVGARPQIERVFAVVRMLPRESLFLNHKEADEYLGSIQKRMLDRQKEGKAGA
jgi:anti-anti-sigma factor